MNQDNKNKIMLYLDVDDTILKSSEAVIKILNKKYNITPPKTIDNMKDWGYRSIYKYVSSDEVEKIYESDEFFNIVEFDRVFLDFYNKNKDKFDITIVTKGNKENIVKKEKLIKKVLGDDIQYIGMEFKIDVYGNRIEDHRKYSVNMKHGIQIDDRTDAVRDTNANVKILLNHGIVRTWNQNYYNINNLYITKDWNEISQILLFAYDNHYIFKKS